MIFFQKYDRVEGDIYRPDIFLSVGKLTTTTKQYDGWFIKLEIPFTFMSKYTDINTWQRLTGPCRLHFLYRHRPNGRSFFIKVIMPVLSYKL
jgi:hypothetical protein